VIHRPRCQHRGAGGTLALIIALSTLLIIAHPAFAQQPIRIIFLHHSVGEGLIDQGGVREGLSDLGYEFSDHGYNGDGLRLADGSYTGTNFDVPDDNTDPDGLAAIFAQPLHDPPDNTFSHLMQYDVILTKSCFPTSNIGDDAQLAEYQSYYLSMRDRMDTLPSKLFILVTQPPQVPGSSDPAEAARARTFAQWLASDEYLAGHPNVRVFDFFDRLAGPDNFLHPEYRVDDTDAHPNELANQAIGPEFVAFIDEAIRSYPELEPGALPAAPPPPAGEEVPAAPGEAAPSAGVIEDFEAAQTWEVSSDRPESVIECGTDSEFAHGGVASLRVHTEIAPDGWVDCGRWFETQDWSAGTGLSMWVHADTAGQWVTVGISSGDPNAPTPFETGFEMTAESVGGWASVTLAWEDFQRAEWADEGGLPEFDPTRVIGYWFSTGAGEEGSQGIFWVDDITLTGSAVTPPQAVEAEEAAPAGEAEEEAAPDRVCAPLGLILPLAALGMVAAGWRRRAAGC
jgi:hypothetical protein